MLRIVFMGTPEFALPALEEVHRHFSIVGVYTQPDKPFGRGLSQKASPVKQRAEQLHLQIFQPAKLSQPGEFEKLQALKPDAIVVVAYGQILKTNVLKLPRLGCINIHSSLLPRWRGASPIQQALLQGDSKTGVTTMHLVEKLDAGDILLQESIPIGADDTATTLHDNLAQLGAKLIVPTLRGLESGTLKGQHQVENEVTIAPKLTKEMGFLDPLESAIILDRKIRALNPWPGTSVEIQNPGLNAGAKTRLKIRKAKLHKTLQSTVGKISEKAGMLLLGTQDGSLELLLLQWEGKNESGPREFLNGLHGKKIDLPLNIFYS